MPQYVSLEEAKQQLVVDEDVEADDDKISRLIDAAETWAANYLNRPLSELEGSPADGIIPEDAKSAILMHVEWEYDPEAQRTGAIIERAHQLLWPYRVGLGV